MKRYVWLVCLLLSLCFTGFLLREPATDAQDTVPEGYVGIYDRKGLEEISEKPDAKYILMADVDLSAASWTALCTEGKPFTGIFDGNGHKIYGMTAVDSQNACGLFSYVCGGTIQSLTLSGTVSAPIAGMVVGKISQGEVLDCTVEGSVTSSFFGGGVAGQVCGSSVTVSRCVSKGKVTGTGASEGDLYLGGVLGAVYGGGHVISDCEFSGDLKPTGAVVFAGGVAGAVNASDTGVITVVSSKCKGNLTLSYTETACLGGIVGRVGGKGEGETAFGTVEVKRCSFSGAWTGSGCGKPLAMGGIVGRAEAYGTVAVAQCTASGNLTGVGHVKFVNPDGAGVRCASCGETLGYVESQNNGTLILQQNFGLRYSAYVGGILGQGIADGGKMTISQCSSSVGVKGLGSPLLMGGIVGMLRADKKGTACLEDCLSAGRITDTFPVNGELASAQGGIAGFAGGSGTTTLQRCFSSCELLVDYPLCSGAIAGMVSPYYGEDYEKAPQKPTVTACYYLVGASDAYGIALSDKFSLPASYEGFDFSAVWSIDSRSELPNLRNAALSVTSTPAGDVDGNGRVTPFDAVLLSRYLTERFTLTDAQKKRADMDKNGVLDSLDVSAILRNAS